MGFPPQRFSGPARDATRAFVTMDRALIERSAKASGWTFCRRFEHYLEQSGGCRRYHDQLGMSTDCDRGLGSEREPGLDGDGRLGDGSDEIGRSSELLKTPRALSLSTHPVIYYISSTENGAQGRNMVYMHQIQNAWKESGQCGG